MSFGVLGSADPLATAGHGLPFAIRIVAAKPSPVFSTNWNAFASSR